jgi:hypothetical protein
MLKIIGFILAGAIFSLLLVRNPAPANAQANQWTVDSGQWTVKSTT